MRRRPRSGCRSAADREAAPLFPQHRSMPTSNLDARWTSVARLLVDHADVLAGRAEAPTVSAAVTWRPEWAVARDWASWLLGLPETAVFVAENQGLWALFAAPEHRRDAPADLLRLALSAERLLTLPELHLNAGPPPRWPGIKARKAAQVAGFAASLAPLLRPGVRVVDFGAGHGHLTAHLARAFGVDAVGVDREEARVDRARALHGDAVRFVAADLLAEAGIDLGPDDLVVALHACGPLCDRALDRAASAGASVAWASCCLHRFGAAGWRPSARPLTGAPSPYVPAESLGLGNLALGEQGVEASRTANLAARARRRALRHLLAARGVALDAGAELAGLNRRRAHGDLKTLSEQVFANLGLSPPLDHERGAAQTLAALDSERARRLELPRAVLGRVFELAVNLDRARRLRDFGLQVTLGTVFDAHHSPRNLGGIAQSP